MAPVPGGAREGRPGGGVHDDPMELPSKRAPAVGRRSAQHRHMHALGGGAPRRAGGSQQRTRCRVPGRMGGRAERRRERRERRERRNRSGRVRHSARRGDGEVAGVRRAGIRRERRLRDAVLTFS